MTDDETACPLTPFGFDLSGIEEASLRIDVADDRGGIDGRKLHRGIAG